MWLPSTLVSDVGSRGHSNWRNWRMTQWYNFNKTTVRRSISSTKNPPATWTAVIWQISGWVTHHFFSYNVSWSAKRCKEQTFLSLQPFQVSWWVAKRMKTASNFFYQQVYFNRCSAYEWFRSPKLPWFSVCLTTEFYRPRRTIPKMPTPTSNFSCKFYQHFGGLADLKTLKVNSCFHLSPHVRCAVLRRDGL